MKTHITLILLFSLTGSLTAQTTLKRYKRLKEGSSNNNLVTITASSATVSVTNETSTSKTIFDLSERGQAAALGSKTNDQTTELLNKKFLSEQKKKASVVDLTTRNITITFSIARTPSYSKDNFSAYDRIENINYSFEMDTVPTVSSEVKFIKWNKYNTEYGTLDIGSLEYNQSFTANLDVTGKIGASTTNKSTIKDGDNTTETTILAGPEASATGKTGYSRSRKENQMIKQRYIQLTGSFQDRKFNIHQQGNRETELAGNVSIDLSIKLPMDETVFTGFSGLYNEANTINTPDKVKMDHVRYKIPDTSLLPNGITGKLGYGFSVRHIHKKAKTFQEFDDIISFINGQNSNRITLIKKEELKVPIYFIKITQPGKTASLKYDDAATSGVIRFSSYDEAAEFKSWLIHTIPNISKGDLKIMGKTISFEGLSVTDNSIKTDFSKIVIDVM